jgi:8-oxo-dGTP pyrophosphatase MutT (NUDIX family)
MELGARIQSALARRPPRQEDAPDLRWAAVALILAPGAERGEELLLIRRALRDGDPWSGHVALPGGRRDPADADLLGTALRETWEETGIELPREACLGQLDDLSPRRATPLGIAVRPFVFSVGSRPLLRLSSEVAAELWTPLAQLRAERAIAQVDVRGSLREEPAVMLGGAVLWGMTLRILDGFFERLG